MDKARVPLSGKPPTSQGSTPTEETRPDGQKADHWILPEAERAKGFVRPVRTKYIHVGSPGPEYPLRPLTPEERERHGDYYGPDAMYEPYPPGAHGSAVGSIWSQDRLAKADRGCGTVTSMPLAIAETYAREPHYYGSTFCCGCGKYLPVGRQGEFVWDDGSGERVGT